MDKILSDIGIIVMSLSSPTLTELVAMYLCIIRPTDYIHLGLGFHIYARYQNGGVQKWPPLHMAQIFAVKASNCPTNNDTDKY